MPRLKKPAATLLLALVAAAGILPLAAAGAARRGCHCAVRMACCEDGTCTMGRDEPPATNPEWRGCRREAPTAATTPLDAFERALTSSNDDESERDAGRIADGTSVRTRPNAPDPATPPPRLFSF